MRQSGNYFCYQKIVNLQPSVFSLQILFYQIKKIKFYLMSPFFGPLLTSFVFLIYQYDFHFIVSLLKSQIHQTVNFNWVHVVLFNCYLMISPIIILLFAKHFKSVRWPGITISLLILAFVALSDIGLYSLQNEQNFEFSSIIVAVVYTLTTPIYYVMLMVYVQYIRQCGHFTKAICLCIIQAFDLCQILLEKVVEQKEEEDSIPTLRLILKGSLIITPLFVYFARKQQVYKGGENEKMDDIVISVCIIVMINLFPSLMNSDYLYFYIQQNELAPTFFLVMALAEFCTPMVIGILFKGSHKKLLITGWVYMALVTGFQYIILRAVIKNVNFYLTSSLLGMLNSCAISFAAFNDSFLIEYYLVSLSLSNGLFYLFQTFLTRFYEGIVVCMVLEGMCFLYFVVFRRKLKSE